MNQVSKITLLLIMICTPLIVSSQCAGIDIRINEIHYDNTGTDVGEFVEIRIADPQPVDLANYSIVLYNGLGGGTYGSTYLLSAAASVTSSGGYSYYVLNIAGIQNGAPDGLAFFAPCGLVSFLSYEGSFAATNGPANGVTSTDIGVLESDATTVGMSLQLLESGWSGPIAETKGATNDVVIPSSCTIDSIQMVSIGTCNDMSNQYDAVLKVFYQNPPASGTLNINGQSASIISSPQDITLSDLSSDGLPVSISASFSASPTCTLDTMNAFTSPIACFDCSAITARINEFHYDDASTDTDEFVEIRIEDPQPFDLTQYTVSLYNGGNGTAYDTKTLDQFNATSNLGFTYYTFDYSAIQNGSPDGIALSGPCGIIDFLSYEGSFVAVGGIADGITSTDIGVEEDGDPEGLSLQLLTTGWTGPIPITKGAQNEVFTDCNEAPIFTVDKPIICLGDSLTLSLERKNSEGAVITIIGSLLIQQIISNDELFNIRIEPLEAGNFMAYAYLIIHGCNTPTDSLTFVVESEPIANAGPDLEVCSNGNVVLMGSGLGIWSGGLGVFSDVNDSISTYSPHPSEADTTVQLKRSFTNTCGTAMDDMMLNVVSPPPAVQLNCIANVNVSIGGDCILEVTPEMVLSDPDEAENYLVLIYDQNDKIISQGQIVKRDMIGKTFKYSLLGPTPCNQNSCWGQVLIEDKLPPILTVPMDTVIYCIESAIPAVTGEATVEDCGPTKKYHQDENQEFACTEDGGVLRIITRTWFGVDDIGNVVSGQQKITVLNLPDSLLRAPLTLVEVSCEQSTNPDSILDYYGVSAAYPFYLNLNDNTASPLLNGGICNYAVTYVDGKKINICGEQCASAYKMARTWTVLNWCAGTTSTFIQIIKVYDHIAPTIIVQSPNKSFGTSAWSCTADVDLPQPSVSDNCDEHAKVIAIEGPEGVTITLINGIWRAYGIPKGNHIFTYYAEDCCGNQSTNKITIVVEDKNPPFALAKEFITLSLTKSGNDTIVSLAKLTPNMVDNASYDNCSSVYLEIRREIGSPKCLNEGDLWNHDNNVETPRITWNNNITYNDERNGLGQSNPIHLNDRIYDTDHGQLVKFCCEDLVTSSADFDGDGVNDIGYHKVWLRVWDDADMDGIYGSDGDLYNETWTIVKLEDNIVPIVSCERNITAYCNEDLGKLNLSSQWKITNGNVPSEWLPWVEGPCDYEIEYKDEGSVNTCGVGSFVRTYRVAGGKNKSVYSTCTQNIEILLFRQGRPRLDWPISLHTWTKCTLTEQDVLNNTVKAASYIYKDVLNLNYVPYLSSDWFEVDFNGPNLGKNCYDANNNEIADAETGSNGLTPIGDGLTENLENKTRFNPNWYNIGCSVFGRKIIIDEYTVGEGCKKWIVRFEYIDWCNPEWAACVSTLYKYEDDTPPTIEVSMSDTISIDANCVASWMTSPRGIDDGGCEAGYHWVVTIQTGGAGLVKTALGNSPKLTFDKVPVGKWTVHYKLTDGCGNVSEKTAMLLVEGKDPTPYCISISSAVMKDGTVELWARDFDKNSFANCIENSVLYFTFNNMNPVLSKLAEVHYFKGAGIPATEAEYKAGEAQKWLPVIKETVWPGGEVKREVTGGTSGRLFGCKVGDGSTFPVAKVKMTVWDRDLLSDFCEVTLTLVDNQGICGPSSLAVIAGKLTTEAGTGLADANVTLDAVLPEYPKTTRTNEEGKYTFGGVPIGADYTVTPNLDESYKNGVNTLDLVHIQRHILALKKLDSPYKMIAADASGDGAIRVEDLVVLRKLILGVTEKLPNNTSWRFVDANQQMGTTPWPFNEVMTHASILESSQDNFVAVKIGDVDGTAKTSLKSGEEAFPRSTGIVLSVEDRYMKLGEEAVIEIKAENFQEVYGFQMGMKLKGLEVMSTDGRGIDLDANNVAMHKSSTMAMSWSSAYAKTVSEGSTVMTMRVRATKAGRLSEMMRVGNEVLRTEAYVGNGMEVSKVILEVREGRDAKFNVSQNEPNPWRGETVISYELPQAGKVKLTVMDITGKMITTKNVEGTQGKNTISLSKADLGGSAGLLIYRIESGSNTAQKKMIVIE